MNGEPKIDGVVLAPLKRIGDHRGMVLHMLRQDSPLFKGFGEVYFSVVIPGAVKAWKRHKRMTLNLAVVKGDVLFVLHDDRPGSPTHGLTDEISIGDGHYCLLHIPPMIWNGFTCISDQPAIIANCADLMHDPSEVERLDQDTGPVRYDWKRG